MANTQINIGANGTTTLATAGKYCDRNIDVNVAVPASGITPTGTKTITANGEHDVTNFAKANVNVPVPSGYIKPSGTASITTNGTHDVTSYASASVNVPVGVFPSGTKSITTNGTHDVTNYASASVNVPVGVFPSGTKTITENGTVDVTNFASVLVNIDAVNVKLYTITVDSDKTSTVYLLQNDHLKSLRSDPNAFVLMYYVGAVASTAMISFWFTSNFVFSYAGTTGYNSIIARQTASAASQNVNKNGLPGDNYNGHLNIDTSGRLWSIPNATWPIKAGTYKIIAGTFEKM